MKRAWISALVAGSFALVGCADDDDEKTASGSGSEPAASATPSSAPLGTVLDSTFGTGGVVKAALVSDQKDRFNGISVGKDGKLYAFGLTSDGTDQKIAVARFGTDGKPDTTFGTNGVASVNASVNPSTDTTRQLEQARSLVFLADGSLVLVGTAEHDAAAAGDAAKDTDVVAAKFDSAGKPVTDFGTDGVARFDLGTGHAIDEKTFAGADQGYGSAALPAGGFVIFGITTAGADREDADWVLLGVTDDGDLDEDFADEGKLVIERESGDSARHVRVVGNQILATGYSEVKEGDTEVVQPALIRTSIDGELDETFGEGGIAQHKVLGAITESYQFGVQGENYVMTGYGKDTEDGKLDLVAYRFTKDGDLDTTFGTNGHTVVDNIGEDDRGRNLVVLPDNRILYVGSGKVDATNQQAMVVVLTRDGQRDPAYGNNGMILTDLGSPGDAWFGVALSPDGKTVYLAGYTNVASDSTINDDAVLGRLTLAA